MTCLLFLDTSAVITCVALALDGDIKAQAVHEHVMEQASVLPDMIQQVLAAAGIGLNRVDALCICGGPGSYTGLRVGLSTVKGIAYALDKPVMLFNRLELLAAARQEREALAVLLKARKGEYFYALYDPGLKPRVLPRHVFASELESLLPSAVPVLTDEEEKGWLPNPPLFINSGAPVSVRHWLPMATARYQQQQFDDLAYCEPFYLKAAYTTTPKNNIL